MEMEIKVLLCALVLVLYCVFVRLDRYCWSTWLLFAKIRLNRVKIFTGNIQSLATCRRERITNTYCSTAWVVTAASIRVNGNVLTETHLQTINRICVTRRYRTSETKIFWRIYQSLFYWLNAHSYLGFRQWLKTFLKASPDKSIICILGFSRDRPRKILKAFSARST